MTLFGVILYKLYSRVIWGCDIFFKCILSIQIDVVNCNSNITNILEVAITCGVWLDYKCHINNFLDITSQYKYLCWFVVSCLWMCVVSSLVFIYLCICICVVFLFHVSKSNAFVIPLLVVSISLGVISKCYVGCFRQFLLILSTHWYITCLIRFVYR